MSFHPIVPGSVVRRTIPVLPLLLLHCGSDDDSSQERLASLPTVAAWAAAPQDAAEGFFGMAAPTPTLSNQSIRQLLRVSTGGEGVRVRLSNSYGSEPLTIDAAAVAPSMGSGAIDAAASAVLTFGGAESATVPAGEDAWSDFVPLNVSAGQELAVTLYVEAETPVSTVHTVGLQTAYATSGNAVQTGAMPVAYATSGPSGIRLTGSDSVPADDGDPETTTAPLTSYYWLSGVDVAGGEAARRVVVAFGDSITDGVGSSVDTYDTYPDLLAQELDTTAEGSFSVVNLGISANRVLTDGIGQRGIDRFARDALTQTGVSDVVLLLGINDIGFSGFPGAPSVSVDDITAGLAMMIDEANTAGLQLRLGTLTPLEGTMAPYYSEEAEVMRGEVNDWIRTNRDATSIIDFDQLMQDPDNPLAMLPAYNSGDSLHPGDEGYAAMAEAVAQELTR